MFLHLHGNVLLLFLSAFFKITSFLISHYPTSFLQLVCFVFEVSIVFDSEILPFLFNAFISLSCPHEKKAPLLSRQPSKAASDGYLTAVHVGDGGLLSMFLDGMA